MKQCQKWPMKTDELGIPNYTGAFLTGSYVGVDLPGTVTGLTFGQAVLIAGSGSSRSRSATTFWQTPPCSSATGSLTMAGEALANMIDQQGFIGGTVTTAPGPFRRHLERHGNEHVHAIRHTAARPTASSTRSRTRRTSSATLGGINPRWRGMVHAPHRLGGDSLQLASTSGIPFLFFGGSQPTARLGQDPRGGPIRAAGKMGGYPGLHEPLAPAVHRRVAGLTPRS